MGFARDALFAARYAGSVRGDHGARSRTIRARNSDLALLDRVPPGALGLESVRPRLAGRVAPGCERYRRRLDREISKSALPPSRLPGNRVKPHDDWRTAFPATACRAAPFRRISAPPTAPACDNCPVKRQLGLLITTALLDTISDFSCAKTATQRFRQLERSAEAKVPTNETGSGNPGVIQGARDRAATCVSCGACAWFADYQARNLAWRAANAHKARESIVGQCRIRVRVGRSCSTRQKL